MSRFPAPPHRLWTNYFSSTIFLKRKWSFSPATEDKNTLWTLKNHCCSSSYCSWVYPTYGSLSVGTNAMWPSWFSAPSPLQSFCCDHSVPESNIYFCPNFGKMLITSFRLLSTRNAWVWVSILLAPATMKGEASSYSAFFGTKSREHTTTNDFRGGLQMKACIFSRHSTKLFSAILNKGIFMPYQLLGFPQNNVICLTQWPNKTKMCFKLQKFSPCRGDGGKGKTQGTPAAILGFARKEESQALPLMGNDAEQGQFPSPFNQSSLLP